MSQNTGKNYSGRVLVDRIIENNNVDLELSLEKVFQNDKEKLYVEIVSLLTERSGLAVLENTEEKTITITFSSIVENDVKALLKKNFKITY